MTSPVEITSADKAREILASHLGWADPVEARSWLDAAATGAFNKAGCKVDVAVAIRAIRTALASGQSEDVARLRTALVDMGRQIPGCALSDEVSTDFLMYLPDEMRAWQAKVAASGQSGWVDRGEAAKAVEDFEPRTSMSADEYLAACEALTDAAAAIRSLPSPQQEPRQLQTDYDASAMVLVPREPTEAMLEEYMSCCIYPSEAEKQKQRSILEDVWSAMIAAAPLQEGEG